MSVRARALTVGGVGLVAWLARAARPIPAALGASPTGARAQRLQSSPAWSGGKFVNQQRTSSTPTARSLPGIVAELVTGRERRRPAGDVPLSRGPVAAAPTGTHVTWLGHSSALVQVDGAVLMLDPVWGKRCSPSQQLGPRRLHPVPCALAELPPVDAVVISHDHYDHLDMDAIKQLAALRSQTRFVVPLGVGAHLEKWGVPASAIDELDWEDEVTVAGVRLVATAAQHFSGRTTKRDGTLWASWAIIGPVGKVFYSGDTGYFDGFARIGERYGPFDASLVQIGAYDDGWPSIHMTPEEGIQTHLDVRAEVMVPVHWGTFNLAFHAWAEPVERALAEAHRRDARVVVPRPGETLDLGALPADPPTWWRSLG